MIGEESQVEFVMTDFRGLVDTESCLKIADKLRKGSVDLNNVKLMITGYDVVHKNNIPYFTFRVLPKDNLKMDEILNG